MFDKLVSSHPRGETGLKLWNKYLSIMKIDGKRKRYDCIIGVSGGTDSSYLLYLSRFYKLRALAVTIDNGWSSDIAVKNLKNITNKLNIDLETLVIDYEEVKIALRAYMKAGIPWIDSPTDMAIKAGLYKIAHRESINYILNGGDFRSEGKQPIEWTYSDARQLKLFVKKFENYSLISFPVFTLFDIVNYGFIKQIKQIRPYHFLEYKKNDAQKFLKSEFNWEYYGGHHYENIFTRFVIAYWLPKKFNIDKRIISLSAQVLSGEITRSEALTIIKQPPYDPGQMERDKEFVLKKLGLTNEEFSKIWNQPNMYYYDYQSYIPILKLIMSFAHPISKRIFFFKPTFFTEQEYRK